MSRLFLQLPPELGATRYGPFPGRVALGSDPKRAQLVVDAAHGVFPVHLNLVLVTDGSFTLAPAAKEARVFVIPNGQPHVWPVTGPVQTRPGDWIILGTPAGPRFQIQTDLPFGQAPSAQQIVTSAARTGGEHGFVQGVTGVVDGVLRPAGRGIAGEVQRQAFARALARPGPLRSFYVFWTQLRTGALFTPYVMVGLLFALLGVIGTGSLSCTGVLYILADTLGLRR